MSKNAGKSSVIAYGKLAVSTVTETNVVNTPIASVSKTGSPRIGAYQLDFSGSDAAGWLCKMSCYGLGITMEQYVSESGTSTTLIPGVTITFHSTLVVGDQAFIVVADVIGLSVDSAGRLNINAALTNTISDCDDHTAFTALSDTENIATTTDHVTGTSAVEWDKTATAANVVSGVQDTITSLDLSSYTPVDYVMMCVNIPDLTDVASVRLEIGTDSSNYTRWEWADTLLTAGEFVLLSAPLAVFDSIVGTGWQPSAVTWFSVSVVFDTDTDTLNNIVADHVGMLTAESMLSNDMEAIRASVEIIDDWNAVTDATASTDGPQIKVEYREFDGAALPSQADTEGDAINLIASDHGPLYVKLVSEDGSQSVEDEVNNVLQVIEQSDVYADTATVEIQAATTITAAETAIGSEINVLAYNTIGFFVDYTKGDETSYDLIPKVLRVTGGDEHAYGTWSAGATKTWTAEIFRQTASAKVYIVLDVTGINILKIYGDATGGTPSGTCQLGYSVSNN